MILLTFFRSVEVPVALDCLKFLAMGDVANTNQEVGIKEAEKKAGIEEVGMLFLNLCAVFGVYCNVLLGVSIACWTAG